MRIDEAETFLTEGGFAYVRFEQPDLHGMSRSKTVPIRHFRHFAETGLNFLGGALGLDLQGGVALGTGYLEDRQFADSLIFPDFSTVSSVPWAPETARVICDPRWYDGTPLLAGPRHLASEMVGRLDAMGYRIRSGFEALARFMTKPYADQSASGSHYHHSLLQKESGENAFWDVSAPDGLSQLARHWIGGQMAHAAALRVKGTRGAEAHLENRMPLRREQSIPRHGRRPVGGHRWHPAPSGAAARDDRPGLRRRDIAQAASHAG